jgi:hypothetical protein
MSQYPQSAPTTAASEGAQGVSRGPSTISSAGFAGRGTANAYGMMPHSASPMPTIPDAYAAPAGEGAAPNGMGLGAPVAAGAAAGAMAGSGMNAKQREAYQESQRFRVQNHGYGGGQPGAGAEGSGQPMSPTPTEFSNGNVTVHEDAGVFNPEIPPT